VQSEAPQLRDECRSYRILDGCGTPARFLKPNDDSHPPLPSVGIPKIFHFGSEGLHNVLVIELLGPSMEDLFDMCGRKFSLKTACLVARQMVSGNEVLVTTF
jgi:casein kinase 1